MSTTQEDYFGNAVEADAPPVRHKHRHRHKHGKSRSYTPPESETEFIPQEEDYPEEREYKKPSRRHRHREFPVTYDAERSEVDTDVDTTDDGERRRRRRHKHRHRDRVPDDASSTVAEPESRIDDDNESHRGSTTSSHGRRRSRNKSMGESAMTAIGLGDTYRRARSKSRGRRSSDPRDDSSDDSDEGYDSNSERTGRSRSRSTGNSNAAQAAIIAAAVEAFRARKEPGGVTGSKGLRRVVEAAVASGAVEKFLDKKSDGERNGKRKVAESVLAGLAVQRGLNARRNRKRADDDEDEDDDDDGRGSRVKDMAASGLIAMAGKKFLNYQRSRSQSKPRDRSDSESPERPGLNRRRSRSVGEALGALGLGGLAAHQFGRRRNSKSSKRPGSPSSDSSLSDSDLSIDERTEKERVKRLRRKEIISIALAILATLQLGNVSYEARQKRALRKEKLDSGRINEKESDRMRNKAMLKDATAVGLAILAAAEAVKAFRGVQNSRRTFHQFQEKRPQIEQHRRRKLIQQELAEERTRSSLHSEASRYYSQPGYMGPPPGSWANTPGYPAYPTSGPIPTYAGQDAYSTRDRREIPVVYPSSVTHA